MAASPAFLTKDALRLRSHACRRGLGDEEFLPGIYARCAALVEALIQGLALVDGNNRTAILAANAMLELNGVELSYEPEDVVDFDGIVTWLREHSEEWGDD